MDVPLTINDMGISQGLKEYNEKSSTICYEAIVVELFCYFIRLVLSICLMVCRQNMVIRVFECRN